MIDLHCHTTLSDGTLEPEMLVEQAAQGGIKVLAITDHDDIRGYFQGLSKAQETGITLLPAVEISSRVIDMGVHILAYGVDPDHKGFENFLATQRKAKKNQIVDMIAHLRNQSIHLDYEDLLGGREPDSYVGRAHVARAMVPRYVKRKSTVYKRYIGHNCAAYVAPNVASGQDVIHEIHEAGGIAVLAHPTFDDVSCTLPRLIEWGLDGIECFRPRCSRSLHDVLVSTAHHNELITTGGSDWHGDRKVDADQPMGHFQVPPEKIQRFLERTQIDIGGLIDR
jgi:3',5'-nucleoside bisphosphate phosphatase